jgi:hypothetical protein
VSHGHDAIGDIGAADVVQIVEPIPRGHGDQLMQNRLVGPFVTEMLLSTQLNDPLTLQFNTLDTWRATSV